MTFTIEYDATATLTRSTMELLLHAPELSYVGHDTVGQLECHVLGNLEDRATHEARH